MVKSVASRREMLAGLAGAAFGSGRILKAATSGQRSLVCIRLVSDTGLAALASARSQQKISLHPALSEVRGLFERGSLALVEETAGAGAEFDYVPDGFSGPAWLLKAAGASVTSPEHAFGFRSGLLMLAPEETVPGARLNNPQLLAQANRGNFAFPDTAIGRQLRQAAGLIASGGTRHFVASLGATLTVGDAAGQAAERLRQLSAALAAFEEAVRAAGAASNVAVFTEPDLLASSGRRLRLVMGGSVVGGQLYTLNRGEVEGALAEWAGLASLLALPSASGARFLY